MKMVELSGIQQNHLNHLTDWTAHTFGRYETFNNYKDAFNDHFTRYQPSPELKLDLDSIESGHISCSGAALITSLWWQNLEEQETPYFIVNKEKKDELPYIKLHILLALPIIRSISAEWFWQDVEDYRNGKVKNIGLIDYAYDTDKKGGKANLLRKTPSEDTPYNYTFIEGLENYFVERCITFNFLQPEHPSTPAASFSSPSTH